MADFMELVDLCRSRNVYIQTHNFPDPDAIASAFGLQALLAHYGIPASLCYYGKIDKLSTRRMTELLNIELSPYREIKAGMCAEDYIICVDSQKGNRNILDFKGTEVACIDHHPVYVEADYRYADIRKAGSCATLIAQYFQKLDIPVPEDVATALLYGLKMDTDHFSRGITPLDIDMFQYLFPRASQDKLGVLEKNTMEFNDLKAYGSAIENIRVYDRVGIAAIRFACPDALIALVADFILSLEEVEVAVIYAYRPDEIRFSVRSEDPAIHAGDLIRRALEKVGDGGGHAEMSGGSIPGENLGQLAPDPDSAIQSMFLQALGME